MHMNVRRLRYFIIVAEQKHFSHAAELLNMTQPPLSQQIKLLENELGFSLFKRTTRHVELTDAGAAFYRSAKVILGDLDRALKVARSIHNGEVEAFRLGFLSMTTIKLLPEVVRNFRNCYPEATIEYLHSTSKEQERALLDHKIDAGFLRTRPSSESIDWRLIQRERLLVVMADSHPFGEHAALHPAELAGEQFIMWDRKQIEGLASAVTDLCQSHHFFPHFAIEVTDMQALLSLVAAGLGIAIVPESAKDIKQRGVVYKELIGDGHFSELIVAWHRENKREQLKRFLRVIDDMSKIGDVVVSG